MLTIWFKRLGIVLTVLLILCLLMLLLVREMRYANEWRVCSEKYAYQTDLDGGWLIVDDYRYADRKFRMARCSTDVDYQECFTSSIDVATPQAIRGYRLTEFSVEENESGAIVRSSRVMQDKSQMTTIVRFDENDRVLDLTKKTDEEEIHFVKCDFPLLR